MRERERQIIVAPATPPPPKADSRSWIFHWAHPFPLQVLYTKSKARKREEESSPERESLLELKSKRVVTNKCVVFSPLYICVCVALLRVSTNASFSC